MLIEFPQKYIAIPGIKSVLLKDLVLNSLYGILISNLRGTKDKTIYDLCMDLYYFLIEKNLVTPFNEVKKKICTNFQSIHRLKINEDVKVSSIFFYSLPKPNGSIDNSSFYFNFHSNSILKEQKNKFLLEHYEALKIRRRWKQKGFNLSLSDIRKIYSRKTCYYTGVKFEKSDILLHPTLDRIDANKGYIKGNVILCTNHINNLKNELIESNTSHFKTDPKILFKFLNKYLSSVEK